MAKGFKNNRPSAGGGMMQQLQKLQEQLKTAQEQLSSESVIATAGGAVKITMSGDQHCLAVELDPELLKDADVDMLQDMLLTAINSALDKSRELASQRLGPLAGGLPF